MGPAAIGPFLSAQASHHFAPTAQNKNFQAVFSDHFQGGLMEPGLNQPGSVN
jgi:hypothetical protein